jgi:Tol biopolymer transport system component
MRVHLRAASVLIPLVLGALLAGDAGAGSSFLAVDLGTFTPWSAPVNLGPIVNSAGAEAGPALSGDGLSLYFYVTNRPGGVGSDDIWVSQRPSASAAWGAPVNLGPTINSTSRDYVPAFSSDGHWMFFASDRSGGFGPPPPATATPDLYQSYRADIHDDFGWQTPTNLGANVNTAAAENGNGYFDNGGHPQLFFGSDRQGPAGNADLYVSNRQADGSWGPATRIPELSSPGTENRPNLRQDGLEIFFYSDRAGSAGSDIWTATRASVDATWSTPVNLGPTVNSSVTDIHPYLSANGEALVFSSSRVGGSGSLDLWMTTRAQIFPTTKDDCKKGDWERFGIFKNQGDCVSYVATGGGNQPG